MMSATRGPCAQQRPEHDRGYRGIRRPALAVEQVTRGLESANSQVEVCFGEFRRCCCVTCPEHVEELLVLGVGFLHLNWPVTDRESYVHCRGIAESPQNVEQVFRFDVTNQHSVELAIQ